MSNVIRQITVVLVIILTIIVNILANAIPINGLNTGMISDQFEVYFVPEGYVFSIWGLLYIGLISYAVYQALPTQRTNPRMQATGWWIVLGGLANSAWIFLWHFEQFVGSLGAMLILLASLLTIYLRLGIGKTKVSKSETLAVRLPVSIYLGWITVATIANATDVLDFIRWIRFGMAQEAWMVIMLGAVMVIALLMNFLRRDIAYTAVLLWALVGIAIKFPSSGMVTTAVWVTFTSIGLSLPAAFLINGKKA